MLKEVTEMTARQNFGDLLNEVKCHHDNVLITQAGQPIAVLIDVGLFERIRKMKSQFSTLTAELGKAYKKGEEEIAAQEIDEALQVSR